MVNGPGRATTARGASHRLRTSVRKWAFRFFLPPHPTRLLTTSHHHGVTSTAPQPLGAGECTTSLCLAFLHLIIAHSLLCNDAFRRGQSAREASAEEEDCLEEELFFRAQVDRCKEEKRRRCSLFFQCCSHNAFLQASGGYEVAADPDS